MTSSQREALIAAAIAFRRFFDYVHPMDLDEERSRAEQFVDAMEAARAVFDEEESRFGDGT